jgi:hypothetical protein
MQSSFLKVTPCAMRVAALSEVSEDAPVKGLEPTMPRGNPATTRPDESVCTVGLGHLIASNKIVELKRPEVA